MSDRFGQDARHFTRIPFDATVRLRAPGAGPIWEGRLLDICLKGALASVPSGWTGVRGDRYALDIELVAGQVVIHMEGRIAHVEAHRLGFTWDHLDVDSASHLHRLMELNLGDSQLLQREFAELLHFKTP